MAGEHEQHRDEGGHRGADRSGPVRTVLFDDPRPGPPEGFDALSCGAIVYREDPEGRRYLVLHYAAGHWDFVKGHLEPGESERDTVVRECREETGITDLDFQPGFLERLQYTVETSEGPVRKLVLLRAARTAGPAEAVALSAEHGAHAWLPFHEAVHRLTYPNAAQALAKADAFLDAR